MNFLNLSPLVLGIGLAAIAGVLFLLQQLRIRYTEVPVATTMFWAAAVREAPVRILRQRFRHLPAYLLILLICWLMWMGFGGPALEHQRSSGFSVLVIDGSAHSAAGDSFEQSKRQLLNDVTRFSSESREVFLSGEHNVKLLAAGEEKLVLERRLNEFSPVAARSSLDELLRLLPRNSDYPDEVNIVVYGHAPISQSILDSIPEGFNVTRRTEGLEEVENRGIVALGIGEAMSGQWDRVDVLFRIDATEGLDTSIEDLSVRSSDQAIAGDRIEQVGDNEFRVQDVVADGSTFEVEIGLADDLDFDNIARVALPTKERIQVAIGSQVDSAIRLALASDPAIEIVSTGEDVTVLGTGEPETSSPFLRTVPMSEQE